MTADDSIKCQCKHSGMTGQVGGFQNPGVCLQAFPYLSSLPPPRYFYSRRFLHDLSLSFLVLALKLHGFQLKLRRLQKMTGIPCRREGWDRVKEGTKLLTILPEHLPLCRYKKNFTAFDFVSLFTGHQFYQKILVRKICLSNRKPRTFMRHWLTKLNQFTPFKVILHSTGLCGGICKRNCGMPRGYPWSTPLPPLPG